MGSLFFPAGSPAVLICAEPGAGGEVDMSAGISIEADQPGKKIHSGSNGCLWSA